MRSSFEIVDATGSGAETDLISLTAVKLDLGITGDDDNAKLLARIDRASRALAELCDRSFGLVNVIETFVFGRCEVWSTEQPLLLRQYPVLQVNTAIVDGVELAEDDIEVDFDKGMIRRKSAAWSGRVVIDYIGGYDLPDGAPASLAALVIEAVRQWDALDSVTSSGGQTVRSLTHGDVRVDYQSGVSASSAQASSSLPPSVIAAAKKFKRLTV